MTNQTLNSMKQETLSTPSTLSPARAKHSPLPWNAKGINRSNDTIKDAKNRAVVFMADCGTYKADSEIICQAVNSHHELLEALKALLEERYCADGLEEFDADGNWTSTSPASIKARAAISKVEGK